MPRAAASRCSAWAPAFLCARNKSKMAITSFGGREGNPDLRLRASELLTRYPQIEAEELRELLQFYNSAPAIDTALLTCDPAILPKITLFLTEQRPALHHQAKLGLLLFVTLATTALTLFAIGAGL